MPKIMSFYSGLIKCFQSDRVLKELLSQVYEDAPKNAAMPYMYINLDLIEDIFTYDNLAHRVKVSCHIFCDSFEDMIRIIKELRSSFYLHLRKMANTILSSMRHKIICTPSNSFESVIHIEVLSSDLGED